MIRVSFYFLTAFFAISAEAQVLNSVFKTLDTINNGEICRPGDALICSEERNNDQQCALELCGPPGKNFKSDLNDSTYDQWVLPDVMNKFPDLIPKIRAKADRVLAQNKKELILLKKAAENPAEAFNFSNWNQSDYSNFTYVYDEFVSLEIDATRPVSDRLTVRTKNMSDKSAEFIAGAESYIRVIKKNSLADYSTGLRDGLYTPEEAINSVQKSWEPVMSDFKKFPEKFPDSEVYEELSRKLKNPPADSFELSDLIRDLYYATINADRYMGRPESVLQETCDQTCQRGIQHYIKGINLKAMASDLENSLQDKAIISSEIAGCKAELASAGLKDSEIDNFLKVYPDAKKRFLENALTGFSDESRKVVEDYVNNKLQLDYGNHGNPDKVKKFLQRFEDSSSGNSSGPDDQKILTDLVARATRGNRPLRVELNLCNGGSGLISDAFTASDNVVHVSPFSCTYAHLGKQIVAHELGHALSNLVKEKKLSVHSSESFMQQRACLKKNVEASPSDSRSSLGFTDDYQTTEEDQADVISFLSYPDEPSMAACSMLRFKEGSAEYQSLDFINDHSLSSHAHPFLRVIREALYKNKTLPASCKAITENNQNNFRFNLCK